MLAYAFRVLSERGYVNISPESFENTTNLLSAILDKGVTQLIKQGIRSDYIPTIENTGSPVGKINLAESIKSQYTVTHRLVCEHELFVPDIFLNQIIKATLTIATHAKEVDPNIQKSLRRNAFYFHDVSDINPRTIRWSDIRYDRNNASYKMLVNICYLLITGLLQCEDENGHMQVANIIDDQKMHRLYERFILEYYTKECPQVTARASQIPWALDDGVGTLLPVMQSDITLTRGSRVLIVDAKYYTHTLQTQYDVHTIHSGNLYQIFTYVKNKDFSFGAAPHTVSGMLLYATTDEAIQPNNSYQMSGNKISVRTLDLYRDFSEIATQLNAIVEEHFS